VLNARYYDKLDEKKVRCCLCPQNCLIYPGHVGVCFVRYNQDGHLIPLTYGRVSSVHLDPIEKKPLYFFHPGSTILSVGAIGCNLGCPICQNWQIAQPKDLLKKGLLPRGDARQTVGCMTKPLSVARLVELAEQSVSKGNLGVAFTYNEPFIWFEYLLEAAKAIKAKGLKNVLVTNGYVNEEPLVEVLPYIDALNIDLKAFDEDFYRRIGGHLKPVLRTIELANSDCHIEITNLLIPGLNTDKKQIADLVDWVADTVGRETPLHFSRYFPARRCKEPPTTAEDLMAAKKIAARRLKSVTLGNI